MSLINANFVTNSSTPSFYSGLWGYDYGIQSYYAAQNSIFTPSAFQLPEVNLYDVYTKALKVPNYNYSNYNLFDCNFTKTSTSSQYLPNGTLQELGYNSSKGQKLGEIAARNVTHFGGRCAASVRKAIDKAGLSNGESGNAHQYITQLRKNPNFREISTEGLNLKTLPAGCILVYDKGVSGYSKDYGHIEITDGKGSANSDGRTTNIRAGAHVFIPV